MIIAKREDLSEYMVEVKDKLCPVTGYGVKENGDIKVYVHDGDSWEQQRLTLFHEILEAELDNRVKHSLIDKLAIDLIDGASQLGFLK